MTYENIKWIGDDTDELFDTAFEEFKTWKVAAFDLEEYLSKELCLIQISTPITIYLFDVLAMVSSTKFKE